MRPLSLSPRGSSAIVPILLATLLALPTASAVDTAIRVNANADLTKDVTTWVENTTRTDFRSSTGVPSPTSPKIQPDPSKCGTNNQAKNPEYLTIDSARQNVSFDDGSLTSPNPSDTSRSSLVGGCGEIGFRFQPPVGVSAFQLTFRSGRTVTRPQGAQSTVPPADCIQELHIANDTGVVQNTFPIFAPESNSQPPTNFTFPAQIPAHSQWANITFYFADRGAEGASGQGPGATTSGLTTGPTCAGWIQDLHLVANGIPIAPGATRAGSSTHDNASITQESLLPFSPPTFPGYTANVSLEVRVSGSANVTAILAPDGARLRLSDLPRASEAGQSIITIPGDLVATHGFGEYALDITTTTALPPPAPAEPVSILPLIIVLMALPLAPAALALRGNVVYLREARGRFQNTGRANATILGVAIALYAILTAAVLFVPFLPRMSLLPLALDGWLLNGLYAFLVVFFTTMWIVPTQFSMRAMREDNEQRAKLEAKFRGLLDAAPDAMVILGPDGLIQLVNKRFEEVFGYERAQAIGRSVDLLAAAEDRERLRVSANAGQVTTPIELHGVRKDGRGFPIDVSFAPLETPEGRLVTVAIRDITERKEIEKRLSAAKEAAESASAAKASFLATMSHEIRTPMNAVVGMSGLLMDTRLTNEQKEYAQIIRASGDHLLSVINDILDFSKIEAGKIELEEHPFDLRRVIEDSLDLVAVRASEKGIELAYFMDDNVPTTPVGDASRLRQVLVNLLSNAVKFTAKGEVVVRASATGLTDPRVEFHFMVRDTGIGIPADKINELFQSFTQVDASTARLYGGTGLGLAICKRLVELMGGRIWVESEPAKGSVFHFTILAPIVRAPMPRAAERKLDGRRALIVDDNATNRYVLQAYAASWGMTARATGSPREALEWIEAGDPFDIALIDHVMSEMDGVALSEAIRSKRSRSQLPIVLLSSGAATSGASPAVNARVSKPVKPSALLDVIMPLLHEEPAAASSASAPATIAPPVARQLRILLAEDNVVNQKVALAQLKRLGQSKVDVAANGSEAIEAVLRVQYDIVFMDVQMPEMDGLEATRAICARLPRAARPRIVAMTANALQGDREMCIEAGMDDYISKPIDMRALAEAIARAAGPLPPGAPPEELSAPGDIATRRQHDQRSP